MKLLALILLVVSCGGKPREAKLQPVSLEYQSLVMDRDKTSRLVKDTTLDLSYATPKGLETPVLFTVWTKSVLGEATDKDSLKVPTALFSKEARAKMDRPIKGSEMTVTPKGYKDGCLKVELGGFTKKDVKIKKAEILWCEQIEAAQLSTSQVLLGYKR